MNLNHKRVLLLIAMLASIYVEDNVITHDGWNVRIDRGCFSTEQTFFNERSLQSSISGPSDPGATNETVNLYYNLKKISFYGTLFGHQHSTYYGLNGTTMTLWSGSPNRSDVRTLTGSYPAVYGQDMGHLGSDIGTVLSHVRDAYTRGGVITASWHASNFVTGGGYDADGTNIVSQILPGGAFHSNFTDSLDWIASTFGNLEQDNKSIPIIFRPWHENNGGWFWWGSSSCSASEYKELFRFTVEYLRDTRGVHNFLYCYSPNQLDSPFTDETYLETYPGDDIVDILAMDTYDWGSPMYLEKTKTSLRTIVLLAEKRGKLSALSEIGYSGGLSNCPDPNWFMDVLLNIIKSDAVAKRICYVLTWRNAAFDHFWVPYLGHQNAADFLNFFNDPSTIFQDTLPDMYSFVDPSTIQPDRIFPGIFTYTNQIIFLIVVFSTPYIVLKGGKREKMNKNTNGGAESHEFK
ncbi:MAG: glycoside hydrolase family 26 protein [Promethearchaeota archaeon]